MRRAACAAAPCGRYRLGALSLRVRLGHRCERRLALLPRARRLRAGAAGVYCVRSSAREPPPCFFPPSEMPPHSGAFGKTWVGQVEGGIPCARRACLLWQLYHGRAAICARPFIFYTLCRLDILRSKALKGPALRCATCTKSRLHTLYDSVFRAARLPVFKIGKLAVFVAAAWVLDQIAARWDG